MHRVGIKYKQICELCFEDVRPHFGVHYRDEKIRVLIILEIYVFETF